MCIRDSYQVLEPTCDFTEFTGRVCPALCEKSCVLKLSCDEPVTIRENEAAIVEAAFREGYIQPQHPRRNGKRVAVVGSCLLYTSKVSLSAYSLGSLHKRHRKPELSHCK